MRRTCVIDTSTLVNLTVLDELRVLSLLKSIFIRIHIPLVVKAEYEKHIHYEPRRRAILQHLRLNEGFLALCSEYDTIALVILKTTKGIDEGEAEAAAQHKTVNSQYILSDDQVFVLSIQQRDPTTRILGTLHLIAWLDIAGFIVSDFRDRILRTLHPHMPIYASTLRSAYIKMAQELGIELAKEQLNKKASLKNLGLRGS